MRWVVIKMTPARTVAVLASCPRLSQTPASLVMFSLRHRSDKNPNFWTSQVRYIGLPTSFSNDYDVLRFETASNEVKSDYGINKSVGNLAALREKLQGIKERYQNVQQDILETFLDRGALRKSGAPTVLANGKRVPGLKLDHPRQLALMQA